MTELIYLTDSYKKELKARVVSCEKKGSLWEIVLDKTIFYPQGGGQPSDRGSITSTTGKAHIKHVRMREDEVIHECTIEGTINPNDTVTCEIDWNERYDNMRVHSAGHIVHEAVMSLFTYLKPIKGEHGNKPYIEYEGSLPIDKKYSIEEKSNELVRQNLNLTTEFVTFDQLKEKASYIPEHLPKHKPLRILTIVGFKAIPDGGTQVAKTGEVGEITISEITNEGDHVRILYAVEDHTISHEADTHTVHVADFIGQLLELQNGIQSEIEAYQGNNEEIQINFLGPKSEFAKISKQIQLIDKEDKQQAGIVLNQVKETIKQAIQKRLSAVSPASPAGRSQFSDHKQWFDVTEPGISPPQGHLHIVTQAIIEITRIFERIGFTRVRHPEVDWDWYAFESLNMPHDHPASDEWETFFIETPFLSSREAKRRGDLKGIASPLERSRNDRLKQIILTPHTSNGQVREMEKGKLPIRIINIAKCYRRQSDISHVPMFHQFEGLYVDNDASIGDLKGVMDFFFKNYYGPERVSRIRPFHFQFTEPSFEVDINCGVCLGKARLPDGQGCKLCKGGWLELGGAGMVHPVVLKNGGVDSATYNGFAFGWGVERVAMMKSGTKLDDIRLLYGNDVRFLEQF